MAEIVDLNSRGNSDVKRIADKYIAQDGGPPKIDRVVEIERLAAFEPIDYEAARTAAAERLGFRASVLDQEVKKKRRQLGLEKAGGDAGQGKAVKISDILPWPDSVEGDHVAQAVRATIRRYAVLSDAAADAITLWVLLSWTIDNFSIAPRLAITSPTKGCGKTTILRLLNKLTRRPLKSGCITTAALFRAIEQLKPTLILDENEKYLEPGSDLHAILNEGHCRGATVLRVLGENQELRAFDIFGLVAFARNGKIPDDLEQRSIVIEMQRRLPGEPLAELREDRSEQLDNLSQMCSRWADDYADIMRDCDPDMGGLINRVGDNWRPLFAIANAVGSDWPTRIRDACAALLPSSDRADSNDTMLLADIKAIFDDRGIDRLSSEQICEALTDMEGRPWAEYGKSGKPLTKNKLAYRLERFGIRSGTKRIGDKTAKGYYRHQFEDAWGRYLTNDPIDPPIQNVTRHNVDGAGTSDIFKTSQGIGTPPHRNVTRPECDDPDRGVTNDVTFDVTFQKCEKPPSNGHCDDVTFQKGGSSRGNAVCDHCGQPGDLYPVAYGDSNGEVHPGCRDKWVAAQDDLTIPAYLDRRSGAPA
jgi:putative DNA primase/helicase